MSESYNQYGLGPTTLCAHGLPNLDTRCPYCERDALRAEVDRLRAELARLSAPDAGREAALALFVALDRERPGWREETCVISGDEVNRAWYELEKSLWLGPDAVRGEEKTS